MYITMLCLWWTINSLYQHLFPNIPYLALIHRLLPFLDILPSSAVSILPTSELSVIFSWWSFHTLEFRQPVHCFIGYFTMTGAIYSGICPLIGILQTQNRTIQADTRLDIEHSEFIRQTGQRGPRIGPLVLKSGSKLQIKLKPNTNTTIKPVIFLYEGSKEHWAHHAFAAYRNSYSQHTINTNIRKLCENCEF